MSEIKVISRFFLILLMLTACSDKSNEEVLGTHEEILPRLPEKDFKSFEKNCFEIWIQKKMTSNRSSGDVIYNASYLPREYHIEIKVVPVSRFRKTKEFPSKKESQLRWFAENHSEKLQQHFVSLDMKPSMVSTKRNKDLCYKQKLSGKEFGFPLLKTYFLRYYRFDDRFVAITCWTITDNEKEFEKIAQYMGMKLVPLE